MELPPHHDRSTLTELEQKVEHLLMVSEALWRVLKAQPGVHENELVRQLGLIDREDGRIDGRKPPSPPSACPRCQRTLTKFLPRCVFCGEEVPLDPFQR